jgi:hypothetical protein
MTRPRAWPRRARRSLPRRRRKLYVRRGLRRARTREARRGLLRGWGIGAAPAEGPPTLARTRARYVRARTHRRSYSRCPDPIRSRAPTAGLALSTLGRCAPSLARCAAPHARPLRAHARPSRCPRSPAALPSLARCAPGSEILRATRFYGRQTPWVQPPDGVGQSPSTVQALVHAISWPKLEHRHD